MVASHLILSARLSYLITALLLSLFLIYGYGLVSSSRTFWYVPLHSDIIDDTTWPALEYMR